MYVRSRTVVLLVTPYGNRGSGSVGMFCTHGYALQVVTHSHRDSLHSTTRVKVQAHCPPLLAKPSHLLQMKKDYLIPGFQTVFR